MSTAPSDDPSASTAHAAGLLARDCGTARDIVLCRWPLDGPPTAAGTFGANNCEFYKPGVHVALPCYDETRWNTISTALRNIASAGPSLTFQDFTKNVNSFTTTANGRRAETDFSALQALHEAGWYDNRLLSEILPFIAKLALELPQCIRRPIRLLLVGKNGSLTLSRHQASVLLANAFLCTFAASECVELLKLGRLFPRFNFTALFRRGTFRAVEKLQFLLHYFAQIQKCPPIGTFSVIRQCAERLPDEWEDAPLCGQLTALCEGRIEDEGAAHTQMDFANEFIGGGVLSHGAVQEEIRFLICPELLVSCLVCEKMDDNEAILLVGAERFSDYRGYCDTLRWQYRKCCADTKRDAMGRAVNTEVLAIDALCFMGPMNIWSGQFGEEAIKRELLKAYVGFALRTPESPPCIATGNWGCGAFGGDLELKSLIQWMAACLVRPRARPLLYYTFGNDEFATALHHLVHALRARRVTVGALYRMLVDYGLEVRSSFLWPARNGLKLSGVGGLFRWVHRQIFESDETDG